MTGDAKPASDSSAEAPSAPPIRFRPDIQGMRALAITLVVLDHLKVPGFRGGFVGVDVFFVISGFLITSLLSAEHHRNAAKGIRGPVKSISIANFYKRRARRILPASLVVIAFTLIASKLIFNEIRFPEVQADALWATFFAENFHLMAQATDYFAQGAAVSPLQNYWSLAVEEQFYFVWPALFVVATYLSWGRLSGWARALFAKAKPGKQPATESGNWQFRVLIAVLVLLTASLVWSVLATADSPATAYYSPFTRAYELAVGAAVALTWHLRDGLNRNLSRAAGAIGFLMILSCLVFISAKTPFPGLAALLPTTGAALLIIAGMNERASTPTGWLLSTPPAVFIGRISYSLYLWHWPIIVFAASLVSHRAFGGTPRALVLLGISLVISWASYHLIEQPFKNFRLQGEFFNRRRQWIGTRASALKLGAMAVTSAIVVITLVSLDRPVPAAGSSLASVDPQIERWAYLKVGTGASSTATTEAVSKTQWLAQVRQATKSRIATQRDLAAAKAASNIGPPTDCFSVDNSAKAKLCTFQGSGGTTIQWPRNVGKDVLLIGSSYAAQLSGPLQRALPDSTKLHQLTLTSCDAQVAATDTAKNENGKSCGQQVRFVQKEVRRLSPGLVVFSHVWSAQPTALGSLVDRLKASGASKVLWVAPAPLLPKFENCLQVGKSLDPCNVNPPQANFFRQSTDSARSEAAKHAATFFALGPVLCVRDICPAIVHGNATRTDGHHLTEPALLGIQGFIGDAIARAVGARPPRPSRATNMAARWRQELRTAVSATTLTQAEMAATSTAKLQGPSTTCARVEDAAAAAQCILVGTGTPGVRWPSGLNRKVALIGNSFASQWQSALAQTLPPSVSLHSLATTGCNPDTSDNGEKNSFGVDCQKHNSFVARSLASMRPGLVIMSFVKTANPRSLGNLTTALSKIAPHVLWISPVPSAHRFDTCLTSRNSLKSCNGPTKPGELARIASYAPQAARHGAGFLDLSGIYCFKGVCPAFIGGSPTRTDGDHLTVMSMNSVSTFLTASIRNALNLRAH